MKQRILSVSYDKSLLVTRKALLEREGYEVVSALGFSDALQRCGDGLDLFILGHSIPVAEKFALIHRFREACPEGQILSLMKNGDTRIEGAEYHIHSDDPKDFILAVKQLISSNVR